jgi:UDP-N-acetylmuramate--alanine ligase
MQGRKFHLIGIGGAGMSGLALIAKQLGATVSGSDRSASSYTQRLEEHGVTVYVGHDAANLPADAEVVISTAIGDENPELAAARANGQTVLHRSDLLAELGAQKPTCIAIAGTHGKTTTTAMIAHVLTELGADPAVFVGGEVTIGGVTTNALWGAGDIVVVEADESDGSFLKLDPQIAVVTNVELDHHATWGGGLAELMKAFEKFAAPAATLVTWRGQPNLATLAEAEKTVGFAIDAAQKTGDRDLIATAVTTPSDPALGTSFELGGQNVTLGTRGDHNALNALAALGALRAAGIEPADAAPKLATFGGVGRRFESIGDTPGGAHVYDDYAHHPTEVFAALKTARETAEHGRVVAVFQPHLYSRTESLAREFGRALALADVAVVLDIYPARELAEDFPGITGWLVATKAADSRPGMPVYWQPTARDAVTTLNKILRPDDLCMTIGAGDVFKVGYELAGRDPK